MNCHLILKLGIDQALPVIEHGLVVAGGDIVALENVEYVGKDGAAARWRERMQGVAAQCCAHRFPKQDPERNNAIVWSKFRTR